MTDQELIHLALEAREHSYCPYSGYAVGAALLCADGSVYQGCNIENAAFSPSICAERTALFHAVYDGHRDFTAIAVVGGRAGEPISYEFPPCGVCRQALREFCDDDFRVILSSGDACRTLTFRELLPESFSADDHMRT